MTRMGHDDMRAALIYQRATREADRKIADDGLSKLVTDHRTAHGRPAREHDAEEGDEGPEVDAE